MHSTGGAPPSWDVDHRRSSRHLAAVVAATVAVDQTSKALAWRGSESAAINPGSDLIAPGLDATFASSLSGALTDMAGVLILTTTAILTVRRCRDRLLWWAAALNIAGWTSNLLDRLGLHWVTAPGSRRGTLDWLYGYNVADLVIWTGCALALAWLGREMLREVGWDPRQPRHRVVAGVAVAVVTGLVLAGMASSGGSTRPHPEPSGEAATARACRDPAFALAPSNILLCADVPSAARPAEVTSAVACPVEEDTAIVQVTITNPNRDRRTRFSFSASGPVAVSNDAAAYGHIEARGVMDVRLHLLRSAHPTAIYLETAVQVWKASGPDWVISTTRLWTTDLCGEGTPDARTAQATLLCSPTDVAHVALSPQSLRYRDDHQPVVLSWTSTMDVTFGPGAPRPRRTGLTIDLADQSLTVLRVAPVAASDVLVVTGWGPRTIRYDGARPARSVALPVGRCLDSGGPGRSAG